MPQLKDLIQTCADITRAKGFNVQQHATQIALMATEVAEALECVSETGDRHTDQTIRLLKTVCDDFENYRKQAKGYTDLSRVLDQDHLLEEIADKMIRGFSYVGGNGHTERFIEIMLAKIETNRNRPVKHGKGF
jgi:hypothetical protein